ncbi:uroporphyrinogen-III synthase [Thiolapillus brandeum]|uniref:Uroporphyrinogen-III synthase n=1 Tax=Thiolapillus brandeum TaxID=1076588 RepID=A0A7U6GG58_9GAMM|nr:uroporphyrinogen-III synthase [Thiolapillus brandeum]BAO43032.1 uroporphyrinogen III synthase [Thiolapillus brandeum]
MSCDLAGMSVLVTRPKDQSETLCSLIEEAHGRPVRFPAMEIHGLEDAATQQILARAPQADLLIFISVNAVIHAFPLLPEALPLELPIAAIGEATARALADYGLPASLMPRGRYDSEGLLALPELQDMSGREVIILRGRGGREKLRTELEARGARVRYAEVYERQLPGQNAANLVRGWERLVDVVTVTSSQVLDNLLQMLGEAGAQRLHCTPLVVLSERTAEHAHERGCRNIWVTEQAGDRGILRTLCEIREHHS